MRRNIMLALVILASASFLWASPSNKKDKKKKKNAPQEQVVLRTPSDSLSYAVGKAFTQGLKEYLQQEYQLDTAYMADFIIGYKEVLDHGGDPQYNALNAGRQIARFVATRILPNAQSQFVGTKDSVRADMFNQGFIAGLANDTTYYTQKEAEKFFEDRIKANKEAKNAPWRHKNEQWLAANKVKEGVKTTASGLQYKVITMGNGPVPKKTDRVEVRYEGKDIDGKVFDSSYKRKPDTSKFRCDQVIKGWTEALTMMPVGSKWELYIPQELAYGERQAGSIKPYSALVFTVELVGIEPDKAKTAQDEKASKTTTGTSDKSKATNQTAKKNGARK